VRDVAFLDFLKKRNSIKKGPREDLPPEVMRVVKILRSVIDPETNLNIVDEGLLYGITIEERKVQVFLLLARSTPECHFCRMLAINVQRKILKEIVNLLKREGFNKVEVYNELGLLLERG